ncbi:hypothetical protein [Chondromyces crocatus]|uniref:hypothetical protein n=1 Tax=Chondromyces crocatus TaxID=52 RepID=UPI0012E1751F|nr:hypothetical protein [Chondromyces crocatus]
MVSLRLTALAQALRYGLNMGRARASAQPQPGAISCHVLATSGLVVLLRPSTASTTL